MATIDRGTDGLFTVPKKKTCIALIEKNLIGTDCIVPGKCIRNIDEA